MAEPADAERPVEHKAADVELFRRLGAVVERGRHRASPCQSRARRLMGNPNISRLSTSRHNFRSVVDFAAPDQRGNRS
jgi:hypothetical protein